MKYPNQEAKKSGSKIAPPGNRTQAPVDYKDPTGSKEDISPPKNSGYDEKQPVSDK
jgi:hypothetical protein